MDNVQPRASRRERKTRFPNGYSRVAYFDAHGNPISPPITRKREATSRPKGRPRKVQNLSPGVGTRILHATDSVVANNGEVATGQATRSESLTMSSPLAVDHTEHPYSPNKELGRHTDIFHPSYQNDPMVIAVSQVQTATQTITGNSVPLINESSTATSLEANDGSSGLITDGRDRLDGTPQTEIRGSHTPIIYSGQDITESDTSARMRGFTGPEQCEVREDQIPSHSVSRASNMEGVIHLHNDRVGGGHGPGSEQADELEARRIIQLVRNHQKHRDTVRRFEKHCEEQENKLSDVKAQIAAGAQELENLESQLTEIIRRRDEKKKQVEDLDRTQNAEKNVLRDVQLRLRIERKALNAVRKELEEWM